MAAAPGVLVRHEVVGPVPALVLVPVVRLQPLVPAHLVLGAAVALERLPSRQSF